MEKLLIQTPQNVNIEYRLASVGSRVLAVLIDYFIVLVYWFIMYLILFYAGLFYSNDGWMIMGVVSLILLPGFFYPLFMEILYSGQTVGKMIVKTKVIKIDGSRATVYEYFIRWVLSMVDVYMLSGCIGLLSIIFTKKSQRLGDIAAGTSVISLKSKIDIKQTVLEEIKEEEYIPTYPEVVKLTDKDINIIKKAFHEAVSKKNYKLINKLSQKIIETTGTKKGNISSKEFIDKVLKDHFYYHHKE
ncbi:MAG: RDD family protein [Flavobacteriales bacterium]|nr:RDD family protein [Flavobacteriales bacterium]